MKRILAFLMIAAVLLGCCGCAANQADHTEPTSEPTPAPTQESTPSQPALPTFDPSMLATLEKHQPEMFDFSFRLLTQTYQGGNTLISPVSILSALTMTANGAENQTLAQIEDVLGVSRDELNEWLCAYTALLQRESESKVQLANSIWYKQDPSFQISDHFLQRNTTLFDAEVFPAAFNADTAKQINDWVSQKTDGMISQIVDEIPPEARAFLINALCFDALWQNPYTNHAVGNHAFTSGFKPDSKVLRVSMMRGEETRYISDAHSCGFIKPYKGQNFGFVAILPEYGMSVQEYLAQTSSADILKMIQTPEITEVYTLLPIFETDYDVELKNVLISLGMTDLFDLVKADLSSTGSNELYISSFMHKTTMQVNTSGTKAGAAASVMESAKGGNFKYVYLEYPFLYMIVDLDTCTPLFLGIMEDPGDMAPPVVD